MQKRSRKEQKEEKGEKPVMHPFLPVREIGLGRQIDLQTQLLSCLIVVSELEARSNTPGCMEKKLINVNKYSSVVFFSFSVSFFDRFRQTKPDVQIRFKCPG